MALTRSLEPTYDPTNFGNEPGEGPLRVGGQAPSDREMGGGPHSLRDLPSTRSPRSAAQLPATEMMRTLHRGTRAVREAGQQFLPRDPGERSTDYENRLKRSVFFNATRRTIEGLVGLIFRKDPQLGEDVPTEIQADWEDIDLEGTHGDVFLRGVEEDALTAGHALILVEYPDTGGEPMTLADEQALELRPYWVPVAKEDVMSWRTEKRAGRDVLTQLVVRETAQLPDGAFGEREQTAYRVFRNGDDGRVTWQLLVVTKDRQVLELGAGEYPTQEQIPVVEVATSGRRALFESDPPLEDLGHVNVAHYQIWSDYNNSIHKTNSPIFFGKAIRTKRDPDGEAGGAEPLVLGPSSALLSSDPGADAKYVSHDGASLGSTKQALDDLKADMGTLGLAMLAPQKRVAETAEAKRLDKSTSDAPLSVTARALQDAVEQALALHARYRGLDSGGSVTINRDFEGLLLEAPVMQAYATLVKAGFPPRVVLQALQAGGRIAEDEDLEMLELEWAMHQSLDAAMPEPDDELVDDDEGDLLEEGNPYRVVRRDGRYCVERADTGERMKCYGTRAEAVAYFRALEANVGH